jgi:hypothetical protein
MPTQPDNKNFLSPIGFQFSIQKLPHVTYFCTNATIPAVTMGQIETVENPFIRLPVPGDKLSFGDFSVRFRIDEDLKNYQEIYDWLVSLGYPDNFDQTPRQQRAGIQPGKTVYSDASLIITTNQYKPNVNVKFIDLYPTSISGVDFTVEETDVNYLLADVTFRYRKFELSTIA